MLQLAHVQQLQRQGRHEAALQEVYRLLQLPTLPTLPFPARSQAFPSGGHSGSSFLHSSSELPGPVRAWLPALEMKKDDATLPHPPRLVGGSEDVSEKLALLGVECCNRLLDQLLSKRNWQSAMPLCAAAEQLCDLNSLCCSRWETSREWAVARYEWLWHAGEVLRLAGKASPAKHKQSEQLQATKVCLHRCVQILERWPLCTRHVESMQMCLAETHWRLGELEQAKACCQSALGTLSSCKKDAQVYAAIFVLWVYQNVCMEEHQFGEVEASLACALELMKRFESTTDRPAAKTRQHWRLLRRMERLSHAAATARLSQRQQQLSQQPKDAEISATVSRFLEPKERSAEGKQASGEHVASTGKVTEAQERLEIPPSSSAPAEPEMGSRSPEMEAFAGFVPNPKAAEEAWQSAFTKASPPMSVLPPDSASIKKFPGSRPSPTTTTKWTDVWRTIGEAESAVNLVGFPLHTDKPEECDGLAAGSVSTHWEVLKPPEPKNAEQCGSSFHRPSRMWQSPLQQPPQMQQQAPQQQLQPQQPQHPQQQQQQQQEQRQEKQLARPPEARVQTAHFAEDSLDGEHEATINAFLSGNSSKVMAWTDTSIVTNASASPSKAADDQAAAGSEAASSPQEASIKTTNATSIWESAPLARSSPSFLLARRIAATQEAVRSAAAPSASSSCCVAEKEPAVPARPCQEAWGDGGAGQKSVEAVALHQLLEQLPLPQQNQEYRRSSSSSVVSMMGSGFAVPDSPPDPHFLHKQRQQLQTQREQLADPGMQGMSVPAPSDGAESVVTDAMAEVVEPDVVPALHISFLINPQAVLDSPAAPAASLSAPSKEKQDVQGQVVRTEAPKLVNEGAVLPAPAALSMLDDSAASATAGCAGSAVQWRQSVDAGLPPDAVAKDGSVLAAAETAEPTSAPAEATSSVQVRAPPAPRAASASRAVHSARLPSARRRSATPTPTFQGAVKASSPSQPPAALRRKGQPSQLAVSLSARAADPSGSGHVQGSVVWAFRGVKEQIDPEHLRKGIFGCNEQDPPQNVNTSGDD